MKIPLDNRWIQKAAGKAVRISLAHPRLARTLQHSGRVRVWFNGTEISRPAKNMTEVIDTGNGACWVEKDHLWLSFPPDMDPWTRDAEVWVEVTEDPTLLPKPQDEPRPLLIVCPQRSGSTALLWGLDHATSYRAPKILLKPNQQTESYYLGQVLLPFLTHPFTTPLGEHCRDVGSPTGLISRGGFTDDALRAVAEHANAFHSIASNTDGMWIEKSPGWEYAHIPALFAGLYPQGKTLFLSRDPVSCVLSMARLEGKDVTHVNNFRATETLARLSGVWSYIHFIWRTYCRPVIPERNRLEVMFSKLKGQPNETLREIATFLELSSDEVDALPAVNAQSPIRSHSSGTKEYDPDVKELISYFCRREAQQWGYQPQHPERWRHPRKKAAARVQKQWLSNCFDQLQFASTAKREAMGWLTRSRGRHSQQPPTAPPPGPLLRLRLDDAAGKITGRSDADFSLRHPLVAQESSSAESSKQAEQQTTRSVAASTQMLSLIQVYTGAINGDTIEGEFYDFASNSEYPWSAQLAVRNERTLRYDCVLNGHNGIGEIMRTKDRISGFYDNGGRLDVIEGVVNGESVTVNRYVTEE